jgi:predicted site-specific integrase-resolvase
MSISMKTMAVIYVRVSSQKQLKEGDGLASQPAGSLRGIRKKS